MKMVLGLFARVFVGFVVLLCVALVYLRFGPRKMHFTVSHHPKVHFNQTAIASGSTDLTFHSLEGEPRRLSAYKGQVIVVHRWGTWCAPCVAEMPAFQKFYNSYRNDPQVRFVVVASMNTPAEVKTFAGRYHYDLPFYVADDKDDAGISLSTFPKTMFYGEDGVLNQETTGPVDWGNPSVMAMIKAMKHGGSVESR